ncbi:MAG: nitroreductase/quinone reductase family protein [Candidatus Limnocylindria bacterium]
MLLTTTGRRSGKERTTAIWAYPDGEALVLVGSYAGRHVTPGPRPRPRPRTGRSRAAPARCRGAASG